MFLMFQQQQQQQLMLSKVNKPNLRKSKRNGKSTAVKLGGKFNRKTMLFPVTVTFYSHTKIISFQLGTSKEEEPAEFQQFQPESEEEEVEQDSEEEEEEVLEEELSEEEEEEEEEDSEEEEEDNRLDQAAAPFTPPQDQAETPFTPDSDNEEFSTPTAKTPNPRTPARTARTARPANLDQLLFGRLTRSQGAAPAVSDFPLERKTRKKK